MALMRAELTRPSPCVDREGLLWSRQIVTNPADGYRMRLTRAGCHAGPLGAVILAPGRTESSVEYLETALDFIAAGFGPVFIPDHRGQGFSPRLLPDPQKSHVDRFEDYVGDFAALVAHARAEIGAEPPLHLAATSMGAAIVIGYLQAAGAEAPVTSAALLGAMIRVNYFSFVDQPATRLNLAIFSESGAFAQAVWRCNIKGLWDPGACTEFAVAPERARYDPAARRFRPGEEAMMTHSEARYDLRSWIWDRVDWQERTAGEYGPDEHWDGLALGATTVQWVREAARFNRQMRRPQALARMPDVPVLLLTGSRDLRAYRPHPEATGRAPDLHWQDGFCAALNRAAGAEGAPLCRSLAIEGAFHELFKEADRFRDPVLETVIDFFTRSAAACAPGADLQESCASPFPRGPQALMSPAHGQAETRSEL